MQPVWLIDNTKTLLRVDRPRPETRRELQLADCRAEDRSGASLPRHKMLPLVAGHTCRMLPGRHMGCRRQSTDCCQKATCG